VVRNARQNEGGRHTSNETIPRSPSAPQATGRAGEIGRISTGAEGTGLATDVASDVGLVSSLEVMADDSLNAVAEAVLSRNSLDRTGI
jgi:hypothetical protein